MSDQRLRELQRRFQETGAREDEEAWLRQLLRAGGRDRLALGAYLGHQGARGLLGPDAYPPNGIDLRAWVGWRRTPGQEHSDPPGPSGLARWGDEALLRSCAAVARGALPHFDQVFPDEQRPAQLLRAFERWVLEPGEAALAEVRAADQALQAFVAPARLSGGEGDAVLPWRNARLLVEICGRVSWADPAAEPADPKALAIWACFVATRSDPLERVQGWIQADLLPWALGGVDPLADRAGHRRYSPRATFRVGDDLLHPTFGRGTVMAARGSKITVSFAAGGERKLVHRPG